MQIRRADAGDSDVLWRALWFASHSDDEAGVGPDDVRNDPVLSPFVSGFGRVGDLGVVAVDDDGRALGAAWLRLLGASAGPAAVAVPVPDTPELAIAVFPGNRGRRIGSAMLEALLALASGRYPSVVLSVREENPARALYERFGFVVVERITNRVGTVSLVMRLDLA